MERYFPSSDVAPQSLSDLLRDEQAPTFKKRDKKKAKAQRQARKRNRP